MALGKDLAEIREELGVDTDEIQGLTKLSYEIIAEIESDAIFNSETYNQAYIRNFVRSYARGLKIKEAVILRALDAMEEGTYDHGIFKEAGAPNPSNPFGKEERKRSLEADSAPKKAPIRTELNYDAKTKVEAINKVSSDSDLGANADADTETDTDKESISTDSAPTASRSATNSNSTPGETDSNQGDDTTPGDSAVDTGKNAGSLNVPDGATTSKESNKENTRVDHSKAPSKNSSVAKTTDKPVTNQPAISASKTADQVNWAQMGKRFNAQQESKSNVVLITILAVITVSLLVFGFLYRSTISSWFTSFSDSSSEITEEVGTLNSDAKIATDSLSTAEGIGSNPTQSQQDTETSTSDEEAPSNSESNESEGSDNTNEMIQNSLATSSLDSSSVLNLAQAPDTLRIVIYAAYDKLEPVRVGSDLRESVYPLWMEQGAAYYFDFKEEITIRGQFSRMLILFNNNVIEAPLERFATEQENTVLLNRERLGTAEFKAKPNLVLPEGVSEPDSIEYAIAF